MGDRVDARAAVLLGHAEVVQAHLLGQGDERGKRVAVDLARVGIKLGLERHNLLAHEAPHRQAQLALLVGGRQEAHGS